MIYLAVDQHRAALNRLLCRLFGHRYRPGPLFRAGDHVRRVTICDRCGRWFYAEAEI